MPTRLLKPKINRVDLVDRGANEGARIVMWKRDASIEKEDSMSATERMDELATDIAKRDGITHEQAIAKVLSTPAGAELYDEYQAEKEPSAILKRSIREGAEEMIVEKALEAFPEEDSEEQAVDKFLTTPEGAELYDAYNVV